MLSRFPPASTSPPHRPRSSRTGRLSRSRRRSRFLSFLKSQRQQELRSRFLPSQHEQELSDSMSRALDVTDMGAQLQREDEESDMGVQLQREDHVTPGNSKVYRGLDDKWTTHPWDPGGRHIACISSKSMNGRGPRKKIEKRVVFFLRKDGLGEIIILSRSSRPGPHRRRPRGVTDQESGSDLDSPPRITMLFPEPELEKEPDFLTSPPRSRCSDVRVNPTGSPKDSPNEDSSNDEDQYFNYLVDNFVSVAADVCNSTLPDDEPDFKVEIHRQSVLCAESALRHYNNDEKNKIKYELISPTKHNDMLIREGVFSHVNFTAKANEPNAKEELFFAELRWDHVTPEPTCVVCFKGIKTVGGLCDTKYDNFCLDGLPVDKQHCYACNRELKHPKNGELYNIGHIAMSQYYSFS